MIQRNSLFNLKRTLQNLQKYLALHTGVVVQLCYSIVFLIILSDFSIHAQLSSDMSEENTRICLRVAQNEVYEPAFSPKPRFCSGWICWQSQLRLYHKQQIIRMMNEFRNSVAKDVSNMNKLSWHWTLEQEALRASKTCSRRYLEQYVERRNIEGLGSSLRCENGCLYKIMTQNPSQLLFMKVFSKLLYNNSLQDFDSDGRFRRANAMYFGCALVIRNDLSEKDTYEDIYHFVCVFCTNENEMMTVFKNKANDSNCPSTAVRGGDLRYPELCAGRRSIFMCVPDFCSMSGEKKPAYLFSKNPGIVLQINMIETTVGPNLMILEEQIGPYNEIGLPNSYTRRRFLDIHGDFLKILMDYPEIPKYAYVYSPAEMNTLAAEYNQLTNGSSSMINTVVTEPAVIHEPGEAIEGTENAWCCIYIFILSFFPTFILIVLIFFTFKKV